MGVRRNCRDGALGWADRMRARAVRTESPRGKRTVEAAGEVILGAGELQAAETAVLLPSLGTHLQFHAGIRRVTRLVSEGEDPPCLPLRLPQPGRGS